MEFRSGHLFIRCTKPQRAGSRRRPRATRERRTMTASRRTRTPSRPTHRHRRSGCRAQQRHPVPTAKPPPPPTGQSDTCEWCGMSHSTAHVRVCCDVAADRLKSSRCSPARQIKKRAQNIHARQLTYTLNTGEDPLAARRVTRDSQPIPRKPCPRW